MAKTIIASGPVIVEDGKVLLVKHGNNNFWKFPGGKVADNDSAYGTLTGTAKLEGFEETGSRIKIIDPRPFLFYVKKGDTDIILVHFLAQRVKKIKPPDEDIKELKWLPIKGLPPDIGPNIKPALKHFGFI